ncbi:phospholipase D-like domain-containing protein [Flavisolibacter nicotianae]|uniref:hypothetical protein n=1 Tax=Flavisolibacter nicotianae TaxID=2364882 RepID=UPI000EAB7B60|nr:hypothetical protein [Flavisolibacter nicotianae]
MINDIIQLLGIACPQLSKSWTVNGQSTPNTLPTVAADGFTLSVDTDEWVAPFAGLVTVDEHTNPQDNLHASFLQLHDGTTPAGGIVLQPTPQVYLSLCRLYASVLEGKTNSDQPDRPVPRYFFYASSGKIDHTEGSDTVHGPQPGIFNPGDRLFMKGNLTIHDEEGIVIDPLAVANALDTFLQTHWSLESKSIGSAQPSGSTAPPFSQPANRQIHQIAQADGNQKRIYLTDIYNRPFADTPFPFVNLANVGGAAQGLFTLQNEANPVAKDTGADALLQLALSRNGLFANTASYPSLASGITLQRDFVRIKAVNWNKHLLGDIPDEEKTKTENVLPPIRDNEVLNFCFTGNECLGEVARVLSAGSVEQMIVSTDIQNDFNLPPVPNGSGNHLWPQFSQGIAGNNEAISASLEQNITKAAHYIADSAANNTDVYFEIANISGKTFLKDGWAVRVFHRVFHNDGTETRGDGAGTIVRNGTAAFRLKDPLGINRPFSTVTPPANATLIVDMVIVNSANPVQSRRFGNIATTIGAAAALSAAEQAKLLPGNNTLVTVANRGIATTGFLGVRTSSNAISAITNITAFILASGTQDGSQPRSAPMLPTQSRLEGLAASKTGAAWSAYLGGLRLLKESRENLVTIGNPGSPGGVDMHTTGLTTSNGRLAYDLARMALRRTQNISIRMARLVNDADYALPGLPGAAGRTFIAAVLQTIGKKTESPTLAQHQDNTGNLPADAATLASQLQQLIGASNTRPPWLPEAIKDQMRTAMAGTQATANHQLALEELKREYAASLFGRRDSFYATKKAFENARQFIYIETAFFGPTKYASNPGDPKPDDDLIEVLVSQLKAKPGLKLLVCLAQDVPFNRGYENIARFHHKNRNDSLKRLLGTQDSTTHLFERDNQVVAFHPLAFPGRPLKLNTQTIIVDDVWALSGTGSISQRGLFFDGSTDVVFCDKQLRRGKSTVITNLRRNLMLHYLRLDNEQTNLPSSNKVFLQDGTRAFEMLKELLRGGGGSMIKPFVPEDLSDLSPAETTALNNLADPNGDTFFQTQAVLNTWLAALSTVPE